jgi:hypothetical protein
MSESPEAKKQKTFDLGGPLVNVLEFVLFNEDVVELFKGGMVEFFIESFVPRRVELFEGVIVEFNEVNPAGVNLDEV